MKLATLRTLEGRTRAVRVEDDRLGDLAAADLGELLADPAWAERAAAAVTTEPAGRPRARSPTSRDCASAGRGTAPPSRRR